MDKPEFGGERDDCKTEDSSFKQQSTGLDIFITENYWKAVRIVPDVIKGGSVGKGTWINHSWWWKLEKNKKPFLMFVPI